MRFQAISSLMVTFPAIKTLHSTLKVPEILNIFRYCSFLECHRGELDDDPADRVENASSLPLSKWPCPFKIASCRNKPTSRR